MPWIMTMWGLTLKRSNIAFGIAALLFVMTALPAQAGIFSGSSGLALQLTCQIYTILSGTLGLLLGFCVACYGLYLILRDAAYKSGLAWIVVGALFTAVPGILMSTLDGAHGWLKGAGITTDDSRFGELITSLKSYAQSNTCNQITVDFALYEAASPMHGVNPEDAMNSRGTGTGISPGTSEGEAEQIDQSLVGVASPCAGRVIDTSGGQAPIIKSPFGNRNPPGSGASNVHKGIDFAPRPHGTSPQIIAAQGGTVNRAALSSSYGNVVYITHSGGGETRYAHLRSWPNVSNGQSVSQRQVLGIMGCTGTCFGTHLHFEWRQGGAAVNPASRLGC